MQDGTAEGRLIRHLLSRYEGDGPIVRPATNASAPITVGLSLTISSILDVNEQEQMLTALYWKHMVYIIEKYCTIYI